MPKPRVKPKKLPRRINIILENQTRYLKNNRNISKLEGERKNKITILRHNQRLTKIKKAIQTGRLPTEIKLEIKKVMRINIDDINRAQHQLKKFREFGMDLAKKEWDAPKNSFRGKLSFNEYVKGLEQLIDSSTKENKILRKYL